MKQVSALWCNPSGMQTGKSSSSSVDERKQAWRRVPIPEHDKNLPCRPQTNTFIPWYIFFIFHYSLGNNHYSYFYIPFISKPWLWLRMVGFYKYIAKRCGGSCKDSNAMIGVWQRWLYCVIINQAGIHVVTARSRRVSAEKSKTTKITVHFDGLEYSDIIKDSDRSP